MPAGVANVAELESGVESDTLICIKKDRGSVSLPWGQVSPVPWQKSGLVFTPTFTPSVDASQPEAARRCASLGARVRHQRQISRQQQKPPRSDRSGNDPLTLSALIPARQQIATAANR